MGIDYLHYPKLDLSFNSIEEINILIQHQCIKTQTILNKTLQDKTRIQQNIIMSKTNSL